MNPGVDLGIDLRTLSAFAALWLIVVPTPGPNSLMITHVALTQPSARPVAIALAGNLAGVGVWALSGLFGLVALLKALPAAALAVHLCGGAYLAWLGIKLWRGRRNRVAADDDAPEPRMSGRRAFGVGFGTALSNAQAVFFITSIFAVTGVATANLPTGLVAVAMLLALNGTYLWFLGWALQRRAARAFYERYRRWMERAFGAVFLFFGARLVLMAVRGRP